jgi:hypothetical protein
VCIAVGVFEFVVVIVKKAISLTQGTAGADGG